MKNLKRLFETMLLLVAICTMTACTGNVLEKESDSSGEAESDQSQEGQEVEKITFPYELNDGKLVVNSLFQSGIYNPDCGGEDGEDVASLEVINVSDEYLIEARIMVKLEDGSEIPFLISNIPAGKTVWAFATDNTSLEQGFICSKIEGETEFRPDMPVMAEVFSVDVDETAVTLNNLTERNLTDLSVGCHCLFDEVYFGGVTYAYQIDELAANNSVTIDADDCYLGSAEVVYIKQN